MTFLKLVQDESGNFMSIKKDQALMSVLYVYFVVLVNSIHVLFGHIVLCGSFLFWNLITSCSVKFASARKTRTYSYLNAD